MIERRIWILFPPRCSHPLIHVAEKSHHRILLWRSHMRMDIVLGLAATSNGGDIELIARRDMPTTEYMARDDVKPCGHQGSLLDKAPTGQRFFETGLFHGSGD